MENLLTLPILGSLALLIVLHAASLLLPPKAAKLVAYLNIVLHVGMLFVLACSKVKIEEAVLVYLVSVFAYTVMATVLYRVSKRKTEREASDTEKGVDEV